MDMSFGTLYDRSLCRSGPLKIAAREPANYRLDLAQVQEVTWEKDCTYPAQKYFFFNGKGNESHQLGTGLFCTRKNHISSQTDYNLGICVFRDVMLCHGVHQGLSQISKHWLTYLSSQLLIINITPIYCHIFLHVCHSSWSAYWRLIHHNPLKCQDPLNQQHSITS
jgi:hypothetical protein